METKEIGQVKIFQEGTLDERVEAANKFALDIAFDSLSTPFIYTYPDNQGSAIVYVSYTVTVTKK